MPGEKILIAEDAEDVREICVRVLSREGFQVTSVENGLLAVEAARKEPFDLLLADIKMPQLSGLETAQRIKSLHPDIVCIVMTGFGTMDTAIRALQLGMDDFLVKPFAPDVLSVAVAKAMEKVRLRRENIRLRALIPLFDLSRTFMSTMAEDQLLTRIVEVAQQETHADKAALLLLSDDGEQLTACIGQDFDVESALGRQVAVKVAQTSQQLTLRAQGETTTSSPQWLSQLIQSDIHTAIVTPVNSKAKLLGALIVAKSHPQERFTSSDGEMLSILCGQAAIAIENARLFKEIQLAYEELSELDRLKSEFINIATHELRTPLAILLGHASLLTEELDGSAGERMNIIVRNAMRLRSLITGMLTMRHLESGEVRLHLEPCDLREIVQTTVGDLWPLVQDKQQTVKVLMKENFPTVVADPQRLNLVLSNLLSNAIKFTPEGGCIAIQGWLEDNHVLVSVEDNGIGIPPDEIDKIFARFYQVGSSVMRGLDGIGLGLSIVKNMVELWGGRVWVQSELDEGSIFTFTIPQSVTAPG